jgi:diamine N-acetyltransferase
MRPMRVELREITNETVRAICDLKVADEQREFVAPNAVSIAEAHFAPMHWMRAIYADEEPAGFVLTYEDPKEGTYYVWRFMVDERYQRRGAGRRAMQLLLERWRALGASAATLSVVPANPGAIALYESMGFRLTGEEHHGELVMRLEFDPSPAG